MVAEGLIPLVSSGRPAHRSLRGAAAWRRRAVSLRLLIALAVLAWVGVIAAGLLLASLFG